MINRRKFLQAAAASGSLPAWPAHAAAPLRMAYFETYSPLSFRPDGSALRGILPDAVGEVLSRMGMAVEHTGYPWARAQLLVKNGEQDAICTIATPERLEYAVAAQEPVVSAPRRVFARADCPLLPKLRQARTLDELRALSPVVVSYAGNGWAKTNLEGTFKIESAINFETALKMLVARRGDVMIDNALTMQYSLQRTDGATEVVMLPTDLETSYFRLLVGKKSPHVAMLPAFDAAMRQFKKTPAYLKIFQTYGIQP
ncbi:MAG: transporter substrate-binding domain-containing protein [Rhodoferax sp.]|nr:transporter substrate-binding domain-containing protein [Rhodoferax sp.]